MNYNITGILIASGYSGRMGKLKALLPFAGMSFINGIILKMSLVCTKIVVVLGFEYEIIRNEIGLINSLSSSIIRPKLKEFIRDAEKKTQIVYNENFSKGMFSSLQKAVSAAESTDWFLYHFVDQPNLPCLFYKSFVNQIDASYSWIQPSYDGKKGHPIIFDRHFTNLIVSSQKTSLKEIELPLEQKKIWLTEHINVLEDVDTEEDYKKNSETKFDNLLTEIINFI